MNYVYTISDNDIVIYIGRTNNIKHRTYQHNYLYKKGQKKALYDYLKSIGFSDSIELNIVYKGSKIDCKRYEMKLILEDYFGDKNLKQKVPSISDR